MSGAQDPLFYAPRSERPGCRTSWSTPAWIFDPLHAEFRFTIDACAEPWNAKLERFWTIGDDGLEQSWQGERVWCNPPYGSGLARWIEKAIASRSLSVLLVPARTESVWFHRAVESGAHLRFVRHRILFDRKPAEGAGPDRSRPMWASVVLIFGGLRAGGVSTMDGRAPWRRSP